MLILGSREAKEVQNDISYDPGLTFARKFKSGILVEYFKDGSLFICNNLGYEHYNSFEEFQDHYTFLL